MPVPVILQEAGIIFRSILILAPLLYIVLYANPRASLGQCLLMVTGISSRTPTIREPHIHASDAASSILSPITVLRRVAQPSQLPRRQTVFSELFNGNLFPVKNEANQGRECRYLLRKYDIEEQKSRETAAM